MDVFEFVASLVKSLAWPAALVIIAIVFRRPVGRILNRMAKRVGNMTEVRAWKVRAKFAEKTSLVNEEIAVEASTISPPIAPSEEERSFLEGQSPREIVMLAWMDFEENLGHAAELAGISSGRGPAYIRARMYLPPEYQKRLRELQQLRNEAVHMREFSVTHDSAVNYARAASKLGAMVRHPSLVAELKHNYEVAEARREKS